MEPVGHRNGIPLSILGKTGARVTALAVGGYHIGSGRNAALGSRIIRTAIDEGVNFLDNAWCYHGGFSEEVMGLALRDGYREKVFLMTKNHGRDRATFRRQLEESLRRLGTERIDLLQLHDIRRGEPTAIRAGGALEEAAKARDEGKIRFIGFTGHRHPDIHREMLDIGFAWDTVQMPANLLDYHYRSFTKQVLPLLRERGIGSIGMKSLSGGRLPGLGFTPAEAISYALSLPIHALVCGMESLADLEQNLEIVRRWKLLPEGEKRELLSRAAPLAAAREHERYKLER